MYCKFCGKLINDNSQFCMYCGKKLSSNIKDNSSKQEVSIRNAPSDTMPNNEPQTKKDSFWGRMIVCLILVLICLIPIIYAIIQSNADEEIRPGQDNGMLYGAWVGEGDNGIINYYEFNSDGSGFHTVVRYDKESHTYYYDGSTITRMIKWSYTDGYGMEYLINRDGKNCAVKYSGTNNLEVHSNGTFYVTITGANFTHTYYFERMSQKSLLSAEDKAKAK